MTGIVKYLQKRAVDTKHSYEKDFSKAANHIELQDKRIAKLEDALRTIQKAIKELGND